MTRRSGGRASISAGWPRCTRSAATARRWRLWDEIRDDVRFALRLARRTPALTVTTILALTLGIGASSTIFAVVNGVLLKPLPYADADRLLMLWNHAPRDGGVENTISPADYLDFAHRTRTLERLEGYFSFVSSLEVAFERPDGNRLRASRHARIVRRARAFGALAAGRSVRRCARRKWCSATAIGAAASVRIRRDRSRDSHR